MDRLPSMTKRQVDPVPSMTAFQVWPSAKCDQVPSVTKYQVRLSTKRSGCQVEWVPSDWVSSVVSAMWPSAKCNRVPRVTKCLVDWVQSDLVPCVTKCQVRPSAKCDQLLRVTECQMWQSTKYNRVRKYNQVLTVTECKVWQKAMNGRVPSVTGCQVWPPNAKCNWAQSVTKYHLWLSPIFWFKDSVGPKIFLDTMFVFYQIEPKFFSTIVFDQNELQLTHKQEMDLQTCVSL